ncbi:chemotaxis protein methyltransferase CheR [Steroidobacter denitrificans]|uniref:Chemotaxis protein methyltransferase n=1 Tax=Steroidobacter denitrificans TaxID=465721 RepID=A0A127F9Z1_STEDE|nr:chemotaxis protein methyltransferase CheR [Steroidobacter denitrificans]
MAQSVGLTKAEFDWIRALILRLTGINLPPSKKALIIGRWNRRLNYFGYTSFREYIELLSSEAAGDELQIAINLLTTNETYFFREQRHFDFLRDQVLRQVCRGDKFRVWSAACSSGEEPYSIAMLLRAELGESGWEVLGSDISTRVLETARLGLYSMDRARSIPQEYLQHYCLKGVGPQSGMFIVDRALRERVQFRQINLNERLPDIGQFDVILLRNVMIYFDADTKSKVVARMLPLLKPSGHFLVGHCETLNGVTDSLNMLSASIYSKLPLRGASKRDAVIAVEARP